MCLAPGWDQAIARSALPVPAEGAIQKGAGWGSPKLVGDELWKQLTGNLVARSWGKMQGVYLKWVLYLHKCKSPQTGLVSLAGSENTEGPQRPQRDTSAQPWYFSGSHFFGVSPDYLYPIPCLFPAPFHLWHTQAALSILCGAYFHLLTSQLTRNNQPRSWSWNGFSLPLPRELTAQKWLAQGLYSHKATGHLRVFLGVNRRKLQLDGSVYLSVSCRFSKFSHLRWLHRKKKRGKLPNTLHLSQSAFSVTEQSQSASSVTESAMGVWTRFSCRLQTLPAVSLGISIILFLSCHPVGPYMWASWTLNRQASAFSWCQKALGEWQCAFTHRHLRPLRVSGSFFPLSLPSSSPPSHETTMVILLQADSWALGF
jgi:hypothetical protein